MRRVAAPLAAVLCTLAMAGCGGGAEPGAPEGASLILDFTPNAVHTGIYVAQHRGYFEDEGIDMEIREPSATSDAPKLLEAGRVDFAILDINDLGLAVERGFSVKPLAAIVDRPLAAVIASDDVSRPRELEGREVGVTGLPSDEAILDTVVGSDGGNPAGVDRVNIGFNAVAALASGRVDAATAFWNAEGVALRRQGVDTREFRVDDHGAPRFPELVIVALAEAEVPSQPALASIRRGYLVARSNLDGGLDALSREVPEIDRAQTGAELAAIAPAIPATGLLEGRALRHGLAAWGGWALASGFIARNPFRKPAG